MVKQTIYRLMPVDSSYVEEGQFRIGDAGMIKVCPARQEVQNTVIHHASDESGLIFGIRVIFEKDERNDNKYSTPDSIVDTWQYHTANSIKEKWPTVLPTNWLTQLVVHQAIHPQG